MGEKILNESRTELYLSMHYMGPALGSLRYTMDLSTASVGTDSVFIRYNPQYLRTLFIERPRRLNRTYLHMLMHCLFLHMFSAKEHEDAELWDLASDIAAEYVIDGMECPAVHELVTDYRAGIYQELEEKVHVLTAERIYEWLRTNTPDYNEQVRMAQVFHLDDHSFWQRIPDGKNDDSAGNPELPQQQGGNGRDSQDTGSEEGKKNADIPSLTALRMKGDEWKKNAQRLKASLEIGKLPSEEVGSLTRILSFTTKKRTSYREFLQRFSVLREEAAVDPDSFDYGFYNYGMDMYGNMPLIEENEFRESRKVEELAIAIDTSASCQKSLVQEFLNETASILSSGENFFHRVDIHIIECDDKVQKDVLIRNVEDMKRYADGFTLKGGGGTDFRPVFRYIEELRTKGQLRHLRGLLYFTDGFGTYPKKPTSYDTAFVFWKDDEMNDRDVPAWAMKLYI
jgi:predicted metal-dependent peptidase